MTKPGDLQTKKTIHELAKEFPEKTYRELEKYRDSDRIEEAQRIPLTESQKKQEELEPIEKGACIIGEARKDREEIKPNAKIKELQKRITELETRDDKKQKTIERLEKEVKVLEEVNLRPNKGVPSIWERIDAGSK